MVLGLENSAKSGVAVAAARSIVHIVGYDTKAIVLCLE